jgi:isopentenyl diphosphate isomerase/L-lactate dehydrogenase-like FMN-dependent dehydrogenase
MNRKSQSPPQSIGPDRELQIYQQRLTGGKPSVPIPVAALEQKAKECLSEAAYGYVAGGAGGERTMQANLEAFYGWRIVPQMLRDVSSRDLSVKILGTKLPYPVILAPVGVQGIIRPEAELASGRAAASLGLPFVLSTVSSHSIEKVAEAMGDGPRWFQLYWGKDHELAASMVQRAERAGYSAVVVTLDTRYLAWRERDLHNGYLPFLLGEGLANYVSDPVFRAQLAQPPEVNPIDVVRLWGSGFSNPALTWRDLAFLRRRTRLPILLKGILDASDAAKALEAKVDGIIVSNHGGRQVDGAIAALDALPAVVQKVKGRVPVLFDSGIRWGADALKALALGADAILLGRLYLWGLAIAGEQGVRETLQNFLADLDLTFALSGYAACKELRRSCLVRAPSG